LHIYKNNYVSTIKIVHYEAWQRFVMILSVKFRTSLQRQSASEISATIHIYGKYTHTSAPIHTCVFHIIKYSCVSVPGACLLAAKRVSHSHDLRQSAARSRLQAASQIHLRSIISVTLRTCTHPRKSTWAACAPVNFNSRDESCWKSDFNLN
jgi:hypothetical protein